jgi:hypothetical protein
MKARFGGWRVFFVGLDLVSYGQRRAEILLHPRADVAYCGQAGFERFGSVFKSTITGP